MRDAIMTGLAWAHVDVAALVDYGVAFTVPTDLSLEAIRAECCATIENSHVSGDEFAIVFGVSIPTKAQR